ncbi:protein YY1-like [Oryza brachyantha]|uniref:protein YY1-like n=1 Tax=Oryza brachyantha TaxID=4533 RepID=UPI001ADBEC59|nr:protein YY1-like [Oryza brachyantha]
MAVTRTRAPAKTVRAVMVLLVVAVAAAGMMMTRGAEAQQQQSCAAQLTQLAPCARFSVPPAPGQALPAPGTECCSALGAVSRDCACGTLDIINSLPSKCGLPRVTCQ